MEAVLDPLIRSPKLPKYIQQLEATLAEEQRKRQAFYETVKEGDKVEFINGEVVMHSPVKLMHNEFSGALYQLIAAFAGKNNLGITGHEKLMISLTRNDYEPDVCFFGKEKAAHLRPDQLRFPAPDFIAEVLSDSTANVDRGVKFEDYAAHGVAEYWIIDPEAQTVEQYLLDGEAYKLAVKTDSANNATLKSAAIPGFAIPVLALFDSTERQRALRNLLA
ncbi:MAG: Uma2 family endonuclease [Chloroflexi bacterium]|nr:Uma2 family endonuclease [Chloroflexota bacterium]